MLDTQTAAAFFFGLSSAEQVAISLVSLIKITLFALIAPTVLAQASYLNMETEKTVEIYAGIAAGWHLDRRCKVLEQADSAGLDRDFELVTNALAARLDSEFLVMVTDSAKELISEEPYASCGDARENSCVRGSAVCPGMGRRDCSLVAHTSRRPIAHKQRATAPFDFLLARVNPRVIAARGVDAAEHIRGKDPRAHDGRRLHSSR